MTNEKLIDDIYQTALNQDHQKFLGLLNGHSKQLKIMCCCFYRAVATNNIDLSLMSEECNYFVAKGQPILE